MTESVSSHEFVTKSRAPSGESEKPRGTWPTGMLLHDRKWLTHPGHELHRFPGKEHKAARRRARTASRAATHSPRSRRQARISPARTAAGMLPAQAGNAQRRNQHAQRQRRDRSCRESTCDASHLRLLHGEHTIDRLLFEHLLAAAGPVNQNLSMAVAAPSAEVQPTVILRKIAGAGNAFRGPMRFPAATTSTRAPMPSRLLLVPTSLIEIQCRCRPKRYAPESRAPPDSPQRRRPFRRCRSPQSTRRAPWCAHSAQGLPAATHPQTSRRPGRETACAPAE